MGARGVGDVVAREERGQVIEHSYQVKHWRMVD